MEKDRTYAVILDLDGTLLDTERATKGVLKEFLVKYGKVPDAEKEERRLGQMHMESAAGIVMDYELPMTAEEYSKAIMPLYHRRWPQARALPGADRLIKHLHKHGIPLALASNSRSENIETKISCQQGWKESFSAILGSDQVNQGKPSPDIFLEAAKRLGVDISNCIVIEDSPVGVRAGKAAGAKVVAVPSLQTQIEQYSLANCVLRSLLEFQPEFWGLPAFEDWVQNALLIDPLYFSGQIEKEVPHIGSVLLDIVVDDGFDVSAPEQVSGIFFGWAKFGSNDNIKVVVSIGWDLSKEIARKVMQACLLDNTSSCSSKMQINLLLVGYVRKLQNEANISEALRIFDEDKKIAGNVLDLPMFTKHLNNPLLGEQAMESKATEH